MPPPTPLFAGNPTLYIHSPEKSYIPALTIIDIVFIAFLTLITLSFVTGLIPLQARVAPITARSLADTRSEHCLK